MKVLQLIYSRNFAGSEQSVLVLSKALAAAGCEVMVAVKDKGILKERYQQQGLNVIELPLNVFFIKHRLAKWVKENGVDIVHAHLTKATRLACDLHQRIGIPIVSHLRILRDTPAYHKAAQHGLLIANSHHTARYYINEAGIPQERIVTIPNATLALNDPLASVPFDKLAGEIRNEFSLPNDARLIAFPGRISPGKGHETLLYAMPAVLQKYPNTHILVAGNLKQKPRFVKKLLKLKDKLGLAAHVHFLGYRSDALRLTRAAELQLVPSEREPFGLVVIEAMAMGTPVIGANSGALPDILEDGALGTLIPYGDVAVLTAAITSILSDPTTARAKAQKAQERIRSHYTPERLATQIKEVYKTLIKQRRE